MMKNKAPLLGVVFVLCLALAMPSALFAKETVKQKDRLSKVDDLNLAKALYQQKEYDQCIGILNSILSRDPDNKQAIVLVEKAYREKGYSDLHVSRAPREKDIIFSGDRYYKKGLREINQAKAQEYYLFGTAYYKRGEFEKAAAKYKQIIELDPLDRRARKYYAQAWKRALKQISAERPSATVAVESVESKKAAKFLEQEELQVRIDKAIKDDELKEKGLVTDYQLGPGDEVQIAVVGQGQMSGNFSVEQDGTIRMPIINEKIKVDEMKASDVAVELEKILSRYVKQPSVSVKIVRFDNKKYYVIGLAGKPSEYPMKKNAMRLVECLYESGLPLINKGAAPTRVKIIKPHPVYPIVRKVDTMALLMDGKYKDNIIIEPGDIIYVPWNAGAKASMTTTQIMQPFTDLLRPVYFVREIKNWSD